MCFCNWSNEKNIHLKIRKSILISRLPNGIVQILKNIYRPDLGRNPVFRPFLIFLCYNSLNESIHLPPFFLWF